MTDYCQPAPDREKRRRENAVAMTYVHEMLTLVLFAGAAFGIGLAAAQDDKDSRVKETYSERCGADRCELLPPKGSAR